MKIQNHLLNTATRIRTPKNDVKFEPDYPDSIIIHYTAGADALSSANYLSRSDVQASAHLVISRNVANIYQLVPFDTEAWHAGLSEYNGRRGYNSYSIGIELDNYGKLQRRDDGFYTDFGRKVPDNEVYQDGRGYWHRYNGNEIQKAYQICQLLCQNYNIKEILGHEDISPGRKFDPGPAFPMDNFRDDLKLFMK